MKYNFTVSPDFNPSHLSGWFIFNTWMQRNLGEHIHLDLYNDFEAQREAIAEDKFDLIYANPYDATTLVREKGFIPVASPSSKSDEAIIAVPVDSPIQKVEDLAPGLRISATDDPDVNMMCMIMLEPADLDDKNTVSSTRDTYILVAKDLIKDDADVGFFLEETYNDLSSVVRSQLRLLVQSQIHVINHVLLMGPRLKHKHKELSDALTAMEGNPSGSGVLKSLNFESWNIVEQEETEFMIDLMDTLETSE
ncbi:phosphate/phosphite/phosphonate ABC transporter substrate-binding protein [Pseudomonadota bacterium]